MIATAAPVLAVVTSFVPALRSARRRRASLPRDERSFSARFDAMQRCWPTTDPLYIAYHDEEWGRPVRDDRRLLEKLCLEGFQSGLAWITILRKRERFRAVFADFDAAAVGRFGDADVERLMRDAGIVRNRAKIEATIANARATVALHEAGETLAGLLWSFAPEQPAPAPATLQDMAATTPQSRAMARELKRRGFRFVGPTTAYALMQACGIVNDHVAGCFVRAEVEAARGAAPGA